MSVYACGTRCICVYAYSRIVLRRCAAAIYLYALSNILALLLLLSTAFIIVIVIIITPTAITVVLVVGIRFFGWCGRLICVAYLPAYFPVDLPLFSPVLQSVRALLPPQRTCTSRCFTLLDPRWFCLCCYCYT
ncbi:hypothetical protein BDF19DRAFT_69030 [Syncephalis fuscata]|nr:hypothetical protein BDF19DRAFT_69030 [Syncephalis fuscata]